MLYKSYKQAKRTQSVLQVDTRKHASLIYRATHEVNIAYTHTKRYINWKYTWFDYHCV